MARRATRLNLNRDHVIDPFVDVIHQLQVLVIITVDDKIAGLAADGRHAIVSTQGMNTR